MSVLGIDLNSRKIACVYMREGTLTLSVISAPPKIKDRHVVCGELYRQVAMLFSTLPPTTAIFIESPVVGNRNPHSTIVQAQVNGVVQAAAHLAGMGQVYPVNNKSWKVDVVGSGNADKQEVATWLRAHHPHFADLAGDDQDLIDATVIAIHGERLLRRGHDIRNGLSP